MNTTVKTTLALVAALGLSFAASSAQAGSLVGVPTFIQNYADLNNDGVLTGHEISRAERRWDRLQAND